MSHNELRIYIINYIMQNPNSKSKNVANSLIAHINTSRNIVSTPNKDTASIINDYIIIINELTDQRIITARIKNNHYVLNLLKK